jgi:hypothetical protein
MNANKFLRRMWRALADGHVAGWVRRYCPIGGPDTVAAAWAAADDEYTRWRLLSEIEHPAVYRADHPTEVLFMVRGKIVTVPTLTFGEALTYHAAKLDHMGVGRGRR